jgi:(1->4)-alpha-D-glucan 1-alpha-D-glucosylmutase
VVGERAALGQLLLKYTVPGLPDTDQGDELAALNLVDPDNRRPVDWTARRTALDAVRRGAALAPQHRKLYLIHRVLSVRDRFADAGYTPLPAPDGVVAFARGDAAAVIVPVRPGAPCEATLPRGEWVEVLDALDGLSLLVRPQPSTG